MPTDAERQFNGAICSVKEQEQVVERLATALSAIDAVEAEINDQLKRADSLRQSILKTGFSGHLVAQHPTDEPAAVLLERIKTEKQAASTVRASKRTGKRKAPNKKRKSAA